jgi:type II secretory pathway predicted ATPase ExeA
MYLEHFGLRERPFSNAPDLRFVYAGAHHEQALAYLLHSVEAQAGVVLLTGESGVGKTTTCRVLLNRLPERVDVALILNPVPTPAELVSAICDELGVPHEMEVSAPMVLDTLHRELGVGRSTRRTVLVVDEGQNLSLEVLEQLCVLSNLDMDGRKLLQIILVGEPALMEVVARTALHPPSQATTGYYLMPFAEDETCAYVRHRLAIAGGRDVFETEALRDVHRLSSGVPRLINTICDRALSRTAALGRRSVDRATVRAAARSTLASLDSRALETREDVAREAAGPRVKYVTTPRVPVPRPSVWARRPLRLWLVSGALALGAITTGAVLLGSRSANLGAPSPESPAATETAGPVEPSGQTAPTVADLPRSEQPSAVGRVDAAPQPDTAQPSNQPVMTARPAPAQPATRPTPPAASYAPAPPAPSDESPRQRRRRARAELQGSASPPPASSEALPPQELPLKIDMLVWAPEPRERMVYVNGHRYVEGETLANGAILQRIEQDGIILIQAGQRLRLRSETR